MVGYAVKLVFSGISSTKVGYLNKLKVNNIVNTRKLDTYLSEAQRTKHPIFQGIAP